MRRPRKSIHAHVKHALVPCRENGQWPTLLKRNAIVGALAIAVMLELGALTQVSSLFSGTALTASVLPSVVAMLTNNARAANNAGPLTMNATLNKAAQAKANDMSARSYFAHKDPDGNLPWVWFDKFGYDYKYAGENLAVNFSDSDKLVSAWLASPTHRENIVKPNYTETGIGMATGTYQGKQTIFVVQFFGSQRKAPGGNTVASAAKPLSSRSAAASASGGKVLGIETERLSLWDRVQASPATYATYGLLALLVFFLALLLLALLPLPRGWPHPSAVVNGLAVVALVLGILLLNQSIFSGVRLPADNQNASVAAAL